MDVSPKTLREVEFREKMRGYHPEDVDQFLERVAAGIEVLQDRLRQALERAQRAEQAASEAGNNDDALRRTLLLAQRTADLAVQEAREQAARIIAGAEQQTQSMIADAEQRARRGHEDTVIEVRTELAKLQAQRQDLELEVAGLASWIDEHRAQLRAALEGALARVEQIDLSQPPVAAPTPPVARPPVSDWSSPPAPQPEPLYPPPAAPGHVPDEPSTFPWAPGDTAGPSAGSAEHEPAAGDSGKADGAGEAGEADPYFAELRRGVSTPELLGPRPDDHSRSSGNEPPADAFDGADPVGSRRFGGRQRRWS